MVTGRRWGKTTAAINHLIAAALINQNGNFWYIAPTYKQAKMIAWKMLLHYLPKEFIRKTNETDLSLYLKNGSQIDLKGADNPDSLRGVGINFCILDEYSQMKQEVWQEIVRPMLTDTLGRAMFIGTPKGKNHFWELFIKGQKEEGGFKSWSFKTADNPYIEPKEIEEARQQLNERYYKQEYEASFEDYTGLVWPEFTQKCITDKIFIPDSWQKFMAIDPAITGTTAGLFAAIDEEGIIYIIDEYYEQDKRISEVSQALKAIGDVKNVYIDPAAKRQQVMREGKVYTLLNEYNDNGIFPLLAENDVNAGINRVAEYFKQGKIKISSKCKNLIYELERYHWAEERESTMGILKPVPYKSLDHACDCLRYLIMSRPQLSIKPQPKVLKGSLAYEMERQEREDNDWRSKFN